MRKLLIIEDEEIIRESILDILNVKGFNAIGANNGRVGLQLVKEFVPDLILCDVKMPELDGYQVLKILRENPSTARIPLIFITARSTEDVVFQTEMLGADGYLIKPFSTANLLEIISIYLKE
ncbi:MAG TPA: response regulator [Leptolyngbyaceae cyanobacterium]